MQEITIVLGVLGGILSALFLKQFTTYKIENNSKMISFDREIHSVEIERNILTKAIKRIQDDTQFEPDLREKLLFKYEHQLGVVQNKIETLKSSSRNTSDEVPDSEIITILEDKLSSINKKLHELSTKIEPPTDDISINLDDEKTTPTISTPQSKSMISTPSEILSHAPLISSPIAAPMQHDTNNSETLDAKPLYENIDPPTLPTNFGALPSESTLVDTDSTTSAIDTNDDLDLNEIKDQILQTISKLEKSEVD